MNPYPATPIRPTKSSTTSTAIASARFDRARQPPGGRIDEQLIGAERVVDQTARPGLREFCHLAGQVRLGAHKQVRCQQRLPAQQPVQQPRDIALDTPAADSR
jgi:hypothetical protein